MHVHLFILAATNEAVRDTLNITTRLSGGSNLVSFAPFAVNTTASEPTLL